MLKVSQMSQHSFYVQKEQNFRLSEFQKQNPNIAYLYSALANLSLVSMQICLKLLTKQIPPTVLLLIRAFLLLCVNSVVMVYTQQQFNIRNSKTFGIMIRRVIFSTLTGFLYLFSMSYAPAGIITSLFYTSPLMIYFLEYLVFKKPIDKIHLILTFISFIGIILIVKPNFLFENSVANDQLIFYFMALLAALSHSIGMIFVHMLKGKTTNIIVVQYFYNGQLIYYGIALNIQQWDIHSSKITTSFFGVLLAFICFSYCLNSLNSKSMLMKPPSQMLPFGYIAVIGNSITDVAIFGHSLSFLTIIGILLTSIGLFSQLIMKLKQTNQN